MNPFSRDTPVRKLLFHVVHEAGRPTKINVCLAREADFVEYGSREVTRCIEIIAQFVARGRSAVANIAAAVGELCHETADFGGERMVLPVTGRVQPEDLSWNGSRTGRAASREPALPQYRR